MPWYLEGRERRSGADPGYQDPDPRGDRPLPARVESVWLSRIPQGGAEFGSPDLRAIHAG